MLPLYHVVIRLIVLPTSNGSDVGISMLMLIADCWFTPQRSCNLIFRFFLADLCVCKRRTILCLATGPPEPQPQLLGSSYLNHLNPRRDWLFPSRARILIRTWAWVQITSDQISLQPLPHQFLSPYTLHSKCSLLNNNIPSSQLPLCSPATIPKMRLFEPNSIIFYGSS
jgi:hypothetical protein